MFSNQYHTIDHSPEVLAVAAAKFTIVVQGRHSISDEDYYQLLKLRLTEERKSFQQLFQIFKKNSDLILRQFFKLDGGELATAKAKIEKWVS